MGRDPAVVLLYHKIDRRPELGGTWNLPFQFERQMTYLKERGYEVVPLEDLITGAPYPKRVSITFDDGYEDVYSYAFPVLRQLGFPATVFLIAGYIGKENLWDVTLGRRFRHLGWDQIEEMRRFGITFGSHTMTHPDLTRIPLDAAGYELRGSKQSLEERLGEEVRFLSYPFGRYNGEIEAVAEEAGYQVCFCSYPRRRNPGRNRYSVGRKGMYIIDTLFDFRAKVEGTSSLLCGFQDIKGRLINSFSHGTPIAKRVFRRVQTGPRHA